MRSSYGRRLRAEQLEERQMLTTNGFTGDYVLDNWTPETIPNGTTLITPASGAATEATFGYNIDLPVSGGLEQQTVEFLALSTVTGSVTFDYEFTGSSRYSGAFAQFDTVVAGSSTNVLNPSTFGNFSFTGSATLVAQQGQNFGFRTGGGNIDSNRNITGDLTITNFVAYDSIVVDSTSDVDNGDFSRGDLTLREAIGLANSNVGADKISFSPLFNTTQTIALASQLPTITDAVTITGPSANLLTIQAGTGYRHFDINDGTANQINVELSNLTLTGGSVTGSGGAINNHENLSLNHSVLSGNSATERGGALLTSTVGTSQIASSTISGNSAYYGGGLYNYNATSLINSTVSGNSATYVGGGIVNYGALTVANSSIVQNSAGGNYGGGLHLVSEAHTSATINNSIVALNQTNIQNGDIRGSATGAFNFIGDGSGGLTGSLTGDPMLGPLADNGGPTPTHALLPGSPALDAGDSAFTTPPEFDQRGDGFSRVLNGRIDIGSIEQREFPSLIVTTTVDTVDETDFVTSLREAINFASTNPGADTITFDPSLTAAGDATINLSIFDTGLDGGPSATSEFGPTAFILRAEAGGNNDITIEGPTGNNGITIARDSTRDFRLFHVQQDQSLTLRNVTLSGGMARGGTVSGQHLGGAAAGMGGAVFNQGNLTVENSLLTGSTAHGGDFLDRNGNYASAGASVGSNVTGTYQQSNGPNVGNSPGGNGGFGGGGGAAVNGGQAGNGGFGGGGGGGVVDPDNLANERPGGNGGFGGGGGGGSRPSAGASGFGASQATGAVAGAGAGMGGAIFNAGGSLTISNSTVSGNSAIGGTSTNENASGMGAGVFSRNGQVNISHSTFAENSVTNGDASGGAIFLVTDGAGATDGMGTELRVDLNHSIFGDSVGGSDAQLVTLNSGVIDFGGAKNIIESHTDTLFDSAVILANGDPALLPLADNGGPTRTHALQPSSPAIDAGNSTLTIDQRGLVRPVDQPLVTNANEGNGSDLGAVEVQELFSLVVTTPSDAVENDGLTSLREAIEFANSQVGMDTITFDAALDGQTINLGGTQLEVSEGTTIDASSLAMGVTIDAGGLSRVLENATADALTLRNLTLTGGLSNGDGGGIRSQNGDVILDTAIVVGNTASGFGDGGGVFTLNGNLTLTDSRVQDNTAGDQGGGIFAFRGEVTINNSTITDNMAGDDGGGLFTSEGPVQLAGSTVSGNLAGGSGGGIFAFYNPVTLGSSTVSANTSGDNGGGIHSNSGAITVTNGTISGNNGSNGGGIWTDNSTVLIEHATVTNNTATNIGGGIALDADNFNDEERLTIRSSIVAGNTDNGTAPDIQAPGDPANDLVVEYSLIGSDLGAGLELGMSSNNLTNVDPLLGPLAQNGGLTQTHALLTGSAAIDAGNPAAVAGAAGVPLFDQRGVIGSCNGNSCSISTFDRVINGRIDIGAYEVQRQSADFDADGDVDGADFLAWQRGFGTTNAQPSEGDADRDANVDADDLVIWGNEFGQIQSEISAAASENDHPTEEGSRQKAAESVPNSALSAKLVDAAFALATTEVRQATAVQVEEPLVAVVTTEHIVTKVSPLALRVLAYDSLAPAAAVVDEEESEPHWLSDELLELVFR